MTKAPTSQRMHIGFFGRRNAGKSSLLNALSGQQAALVSPVPGTTTDPVQRPMELHPLGPVVLIDTAGLDDEGELGTMRVARSLEMLDRTDLAVLVIENGTAPGLLEESLVREVRLRGIPAVGVVNKADRDPAGAQRLADLFTERFGFPFVPCSALAGPSPAGPAVAAPHPAGATPEGQAPGVALLRQAIVARAPEAGTEPPLLAGLIRPGDLVLLVCPIDSGAPKGRLILPQVQAIREVLDQGGHALVVTERELTAALARLPEPPALVVTDSQVFGQVAAATPAEVPLTSFSILMARQKGDLRQLVAGARAIAGLQTGDRVLIAETCTHHPQPDDIGTVKIPRWLSGRVGGPLEFTWARGRDLPADLSPYQLIVHCGGCMINRQLMISRIRKAREAGIPIVNYGVCIAYLHGVLPRALSPFPGLEGMLS